MGESNRVSPLQHQMGLTSLSLVNERLALRAVYLSMGKPSADDEFAGTHQAFTDSWNRRLDRIRHRRFPRICFREPLSSFGLIVPSCYLITLCSGASLDQHSHNISLFNLVEQINLPPLSSVPGRQNLPLEVHAYLRMASGEENQVFEFRYALVSQNGLDSYSEPIVHQIKTPRYRMRSLGLPMPLTTGQYSIHLEYRRQGEEEFKRDPLGWPLTFRREEQAPSVTH